VVEHIHGDAFTPKFRSAGDDPIIGKISALVTLATTAEMKKQVSVRAMIEPCLTGQETIQHRPESLPWFAMTDVHHATVVQYLPGRCAVHVPEAVIPAIVAQREMAGGESQTTKVLL
jgi:hypothetical protein